MKVSIEVVISTGIDKYDVNDIKNAIEAALQMTRYEELVEISSGRVTDSDAPGYYLLVTAESRWLTDYGDDLERRLRAALQCHVEFRERAIYF